MLDFLLKFPDLLHSAIVFGTVIMFGALGEIITEKSGNLNLGVPGIMYFGGIAGLTSTFMYENVYCVNAGIEPNAALCVIMCLVASHRQDFSRRNARGSLRNVHCHKGLLR